MAGHENLTRLIAAAIVKLLVFGLARENRRGERSHRWLLLWTQKRAARRGRCHAFPRAGSVFSWGRTSTKRRHASPRTFLPFPPRASCCSRSRLFSCSSISRVFYHRQPKRLYVEHRTSHRRPTPSNCCTRIVLKILIRKYSPCRDSRIPHERKTMAVDKTRCLTAQRKRCWTSTVWCQHATDETLK